MTNILKKAGTFFRTQTVLAVSLIAALLSMLLVLPDAGYADYVDFPVLILLFCLMGVVAGFRSAGVFERMTAVLLRFASNARVLGLLLMNVCFFVSMLVTNDVALITFVPLTLMLYAHTGSMKNCILTIVLQTAAANLGSMMTPIGNPQNLYLYTEFELTMGDFFSALLPVGIASYVLLTAACFLISGEKMQLHETEAAALNGKKILLFGVMFVICLLTVLRVIPHWICLVLVCAGLLVESKLYLKIDYALLLTFVCFFVFVGNIGRIEPVRELLSSWMEGRELLVSAVVSQGISNVPAAVMLSAFTENVRPLLQGVNIGGLGTPIASLASLISYQLYAKSERAENGRYMRCFLLVNVVMLVLLLAMACLIF